MKRILSILALAGATAGLAAAQPVKFVWSPLSQTVTVGSNVTVELWAMPNPDPVLNISGFEAVVTWDPLMLAYQSYNPVAPPTLLNTFTEGIGNGDLNVFDSTPSFSVPSGGTHLGDLTFATVATGTTHVGMVANADIVTPSGTYGATTQVYRLEANGGTFTPDYSSLATINVNPVPEPATLAGLALGAAYLARRRNKE